MQVLRGSIITGLLLIILKNSKFIIMATLLLSIAVILLSFAVLLLNDSMLKLKPKSVHYSIEVENFRAADGKRKFKSNNEVAFFDFLLLSCMNPETATVYAIQMNAFKCGFSVTVPVIKEALYILEKDGLINIKFIRNDWPANQAQN